MNFFQIFGFGKQKPMKPGDFTSDEAKAAAAWLQTVNPLRGMTATRMQNLYDASRAGDTVHLQWLYQEIEKIDPTLLICQQRRTGALAALDWNIKTRNQKRTRGFDETLAQEQADCLELAFGDADQSNFNDAVEHLARGFFRGFSHVLPRWSDDGLSLKGFDCLDQWNFVRDPLTGQWYWNPEAHAYTGYAECRPIPSGELVTFVAPYHIDYPAMTIYLRSAVGEQGWAKFVERFGIPPVILTMPQDIPSDQVEAWRASAEKVAEGGSGAVPAGTAVNFCDGARGINPFKDFIHNQRELVVLMSTGGLLTSLTESGSGTLAGGAHSDTWAEVRRMDSAKVGSVLNRTLADAILDRAFPGRPHLAYFAFDTEAVPSPGEVFDDAAKAKASGYLIDKADLEERTGYRLVKDEGGMRNEELGMRNYGGVSMNRKLANVAIPHSSFLIPNSSDVLAAFAADNGPLAEAIKALLNDPSTEAAEKLLADLPTLLKDDLALAAVIAEEMAKQFTDPAGQKMAAGRHTDSQDSQALTNAARDTGYLARANVGLENAITNPCPKCHRQMSKDGHCKHCETLAANQKTVNGLIADLDLKGPDGKSKGWKDRTESLGDLDQKTIDDIKAANPNMNVEASVATVNTEQLQHSLNHHGNAEKESKRGQIAITKDDLKRIPEVLADYDRIDSGKGISEGKKQESVVFRKNYPDGTVACVELDVYSDKLKKRTLKFQTMWKEKN